MTRLDRCKRFRASRVLGLALLVSALAVQGEPQALERSSSLRDFASWREATSGPYKVPQELWTMCMPPTIVGHPGRRVASDADMDLSIRVYANPKAYPLLRSPSGPKYPAGSIVAKAKLVEGSHRPVAVAFMIKHEAGYDPEALDWEFLYFNGNPLHQVSVEDGVTCRGCHATMKEGDGVFGNYLPERQGGGSAGVK
ncbi:MAG TPA: cytochrome P460 family protein [Thermoanaerobaculia bacterium]|nr:cytochrome P460 family protein [Thermoanaerobaculia bacterium]